MLRRRAYRHGLLRQQRVPAIVIVVGNITVGGSGKTPLVTRLTMLLETAGYHPGIVSRGYGGRSRTWPRRVTAASDPREVGDEPVLLARRTHCPVMVDPDRVKAARTLVNDWGCDTIVADDGLQHYRMDRDLEIAVIDGDRRFGNGACLPAGPLREPQGRLRHVDFIVGNGAAAPGEYLMTLVGEDLVNIADPKVTRPLSAFTGHAVNAVAGIGNPKRFFESLRASGLIVHEHPFPDHHLFATTDLDFDNNFPLIMTEKDAVRLGPQSRDSMWYLPVWAQLDPLFEQQLLFRVENHRSRMTVSPKLMGLE